MTSLSEPKLRDYVRRLEQVQEAFGSIIRASRAPGSRCTRSTAARTCSSRHHRKLGDLAVKALDQYAPSAHLRRGDRALRGPGGDRAWSRAQEARAGAVEDFRIDFEDGYGIRPARRRTATR